MAVGFEVRDLRNKGYFMIDDAYLNGYARIFGPTASMVYFSLCRHSDKQQKSFPAQTLIGRELNVNERTVRRMIKLLQDANLISVEKVRTGNGKWLNNSYYLLDKSVWKSKEELTTGHPCPMDKPEDIFDTAGGHPCPIKETHKKETHTLSIGDVGEKDFQEIADKYQVPVAFVRSKYDDMVIWAGERPGSAKLRNRNWRLTLMKWVKTDSIKVKTQKDKRGMIYVGS